MSKTWGGRFTGSTDERVERFTESISVDHRLYRQDILASQAHARMLAHVGLMATTETDSIVTTLDALSEEISRGELPFSAGQEDIHTHIENALIARLGDVGRKLHTGRSRNDQIATDMRLWVRDAIDELNRCLQSLQAALVSAAAREIDVILPGYTHLQRAQPVLAAHCFLAYVEKFQRDRDRLQDCRRRVNVLPLGAAALAGTALPIDRDYVRQLLAFDALAQNSLDAAGDRDFLLEYVFDVATIAVHLSGWAEEWILWATTEFGFLELPDRYCTGSSIMPHKRNPDVLELIRAKAARVTADLQHLLILMKGLPLAYNRDLQEDKVALFDAHDTVQSSVDLAAAIVADTRFRREAITAKLEDGHLDATALMEYCVLKGMPMRAAHEAVGKLVRLSEERHSRLAELPVEAFESIYPGLCSDVYKVLGVQNALARIRGVGSTAPDEVAKQIARWQLKLAPSSHA